jgi:hypothetical protein
MLPTSQLITATSNAATEVRLLIMPGPPGLRLCTSPYSKATCITSVGRCHIRCHLAPTCTCAGNAAQPWLRGRVPPLMGLLYDTAVYSRSGNLHTIDCMMR